jgi:hypothetical protein
MSSTAIKYLRQLGGDFPYDESNNDLIKLIKNRIKTANLSTTPSKLINGLKQHLILYILISLLFVNIAIFIKFLIKSPAGFLEVPAFFRKNNILSTSKCFKCSYIANCFDGNSTCDRNFTLIHHKYILNDGDTHLIGQMIENMLIYLAK